MSTIIHAGKEDLQEILKLQYLAYQSEAKLLDNPNIPPLKQTLEEVEQEYQKGILLKAVNEQGEIVGSVRAYLREGTVYIGKLIVHPKKQGNGIGTKLLGAIEKEYPNCTRFELFTSSKSEKNILLYERVGYRIFRKETMNETLCFVYLEKTVETKQ